MGVFSGKGYNKVKIVTHDYPVNYVRVKQVDDLTVKNYSTVTAVTHDHPVNYTRVKVVTHDTPKNYLNVNFIEL
jgi:hypothetical protein